MSIIGVIASSISGHLWPANSYESISTVTVGGGGSSSITFSSIPSTYKHLQIRCYTKDSRSNANSALSLRMNGDTATTYNEHGLTGDGTSVSVYYTANLSSIGLGNTAGGTYANYYGSQIVDIFDYADTNKYKTVRTLGGHDQNGNGVSYLGIFSGAWRSTSAVNSLTLIPLVANFTQYSSFALYGIKGV